MTYVCTYVHVRAMLLYTVEALVGMDLVESNGSSGSDLNLLLTDNAMKTDMYQVTIKLVVNWKQQCSLSSQILNLGFQSFC